MEIGLEEIIGYSFNNRKLLERALTHKSRSGKSSNQRLEYFGDSILNFLVAEHTYFTCGECNEGKMTEQRQRVVAKKPLAGVITELGLQRFMLLAKNEREQGISDKSDKVKSDLYEALLAAVYIDGGLDEARKFVYRTLGEKLENALNDDAEEDAKSKLNVFAGKYHLSVRYEDVEDESDEFRFSSTVYVEGDALGSGKGGTKREAERVAAAEALAELDKKPRAK